MSNHVNPVKPEQHDGGYTLIELMVVVAILGILVGLSLVAYDALGRRGALQNAAFDLQGVLSSARTRAASRGYPVWVVFRPTARRGALTDGPGAFMVVEDRNNSFSRARHIPLALPLKVQGPVSAVYFLEDYKRVRLEALTPGRTDLFGAPFSGLAVRACSFCSGTTPSGAVVFYPDGGSRFVDGDGQFVATMNQSLALSSLERQHQYLIAISGPSGYMASFTP
jgi:prepilin-type N-terminal cleavage/methylation domain-containing protein